MAGLNGRRLAQIESKALVRLADPWLVSLSLPWPLALLVLNETYNVFQRMYAASRPNVDELLKRAKPVT
jgi:hypothetical protein